MLDEVAHARRAEPFAERLHRVPDHLGVGTGPHGGRAGHPEQRTDLAEVVAGGRDREQVLAAVGALAHDLELAVADDVDEVAHRPLLEQHLAGRERDRLGRPVAGRELRHQLHDLVGERQHAMVVRRDHDDALVGRELAHQAEHLFHLDEVEMGGGFVGEQQRRIERERAGDRDPLLLTAAHVAGPVRHPILQADAREQLLGARPRRAPRDAARPAAAPSRSRARSGWRRG